MSTTNKQNASNQSGFIGFLCGLCQQSHNSSFFQKTPIQECIPTDKESITNLYKMQIECDSKQITPKYFRNSKQLKQKMLVVYQLSFQYHQQYNQWYSDVSKDNNTKINILRRDNQNLEQQIKRVINQQQLQQIQMEKYNGQMHKKQKDQNTLWAKTQTSKDLHRQQIFLEDKLKIIYVKGIQAPISQRIVKNKLIANPQKPLISSTKVSSFLDKSNHSRHRKARKNKVILSQQQSDCSELKDQVILPQVANRFSKNSPLKCSSQLIANRFSKNSPLGSSSQLQSNFSPQSTLNQSDYESLIKLQLNQQSKCSNKNIQNQFSSPASGLRNIIHLNSLPKIRISSDSQNLNSPETNYIGSARKCFEKLNHDSKHKYSQLELLEDLQKSQQSQIDSMHDYSPGNKPQKKMKKKQEFGVRKQQLTQSIIIGKGSKIVCKQQYYQSSESLSSNDEMINDYGILDEPCILDDSPTLFKKAKLKERQNHYIASEVRRLIRNKYNCGENLHSTEICLNQNIIRDQIMKIMKQNRQDQTQNIIPLDSAYIQQYFSQKISKLKKTKNMQGKKMQKQGNQLNQQLHKKDIIRPNKLHFKSLKGQFMQGDPKQSKINIKR